MNGRFREPSAETARRIEQSIADTRTGSDDAAIPVVPAYGADESWLEEHVGEVVAVCGWLDESLLDRATSLRWVQLQGAGAEGAIRAHERRRDVIITNASGVHGVPIAEHLLAMIFAFARRLPVWQDHKREHRWDRAPGDRMIEVTGSRALVVGYGAIGRAFADRAVALGMRVTALRRTPAGADTGRRWIDREPANAKVDVAGIDRLHELLADADFVVNTLPHTAGTDRMFGAAEFAAMRESACFLNAGRGKTVDEAALVDALASGSIAGAGLDVFEIEPLPAESPLWEMEQVIITPHISGNTPEYEARLLDIFLENLRRFVRGEPLLNVVDREAGY